MNNPVYNYCFGRNQCRRNEEITAAHPARAAGRGSKPQLSFINHLHEKNPRLFPKQTRISLLRLSLLPILPNEV